VKVTIYMPDELHAQLRAANVNVSGACQAVLAKELERVRRLAKLDVDTEQVATWLSSR
jgi:post-segregation antitoxin (ccd killing protein)